VARIEAKKKANLAADQAAKEFFATESNPWAKIVECVPNSLCNGRWVGLRSGVVG
jgi:hypothetical protein